MSRNFLLEALSDEDRARLEPHLTRVELRTGDVLLRPGDPVEQVWFPLEGVVSVVSVLVNGDQIESAVFGRESGAGFIEACGGGVSHSLLTVQMPGQALRMSAGRYRTTFDGSKSLRRAVAQHIELLLTEARQDIACRGAHPIRQRLPKWLLQCRDKAGTDAIEMTHEVLSWMVGTDRSTLSTCAATLKRAGLIAYTRGHIRLLDIEGIEAETCECYPTMKHFRGLMGQPGA